MEEEANNSETTETPKPKSILDETKALIENLKKEKEEIKQIKDELAQIRSEQLLAGTAGGHIEQKKIDPADKLADEMINAFR